MKECKACGKMKDFSQFHKNKFVECGYEGRCKLCKLQGKLIPKNKPKYQKNPRHKQEWADYFRLILTKIEDYSEMYKFFDQIGYDVKGDIHEQFCQKYGLKTTIRKPKNQNQYSKEEILEFFLKH